MTRHQMNLKETVVAINRVAKGGQGGKRFSFNAPWWWATAPGHVGAAMGKAESPGRDPEGRHARPKPSKIPQGTTIPRRHRHFRRGHGG